MWSRYLQVDCHFGDILNYCIESSNHGVGFMLRKMVKRAGFVQQFTEMEYFCIYIFKLNFDSLFQDFFLSIRSS